MPVHIKGLSYKHAIAGGGTRHIYIEEFGIRPRPVIGFHLRSYNEALLKDFRVTVESEGHVAEQPSWLPVFTDDGAKGEPLRQLVGSNALASQSIGMVTRGVIEGLTVRIRRNGELVATLEASRGIIDFKRKTVVMNQSVITDHQEHSVIRGALAMWDEDTRVLRMKGQYAREDSSGSTIGQDLEYKLLASSRDEGSKNN
jgi:hypothetical protein